MNRSLNKVFELLLVLLILSGTIKASTPDDINVVKQKLIVLSLGRMYRPEDYTTMKTDRIFKLFNSVGYWSDVDYKNNNPAQWDPIKHWERLFEMTYLYEQKNTRYYKDQQLLDQIRNGVAYWLKTKPVCENYWWNAIGVPLAMGKVLILIDRELPSNMLTDAVKLMNLGVKPDYYDYHGVATGQNLLWLAYVHLYTSCLANDKIGMTRAFDAVKNEIRITEAEGIQPDFSFHQHGPQLYSFGYGREFTHSAAQFAFLAQGTSSQFPKDKTAIISHYILDGQQWMTRNGFLEYTAMGREVSRGPMGKSSILSGIQLMSRIDTARKAEFNSMYQQLSTGKRDKPLHGNRYFYRSDLMVNQRKAYYFSIKGTSDRILGSESGNGENLKGFYQGAGTYYLVRRGDEYEGIFPLLNWRQLPGSLCEQDTSALPLFNWGNGTKGTTGFVYGLSDSLYGCFAYNYKKDHVMAKRAWFCFDNEIICMAAGIEAFSANSINQNVNQCFSKGDVLVNGNVLTDTILNSRQVRWVYHDSVAYVFSTPNYSINLVNTLKTGSWKAINLSGSSNPITARVFSLNINLGNRLNNTNLVYAIVPGVSKREAEKYMIDEHVEVLRNDSTIQAVFQKQLNQVQAVCYSAGSVTLPWSKKTLVFKKPGLVILYNKNDIISARLNDQLAEKVDQSNSEIIIK